MKKVLLALLFVAAIAVAFYLGRHGLPTELGHEATETSSAVPSVEAARERLGERFGAELLEPAGANGGGGADTGGVEVIELDAADLRDLAVAVLSEHDNGRRLLASAKAVETSIGESTLEVGVVLNLAQIPEETLEPDERRVVTNARRMLPFLADRDFYLGFEGRPHAEGGRLAFAPDATVKLALFELGLASFADKLGLEGAEDERLEVALPFVVHSASVDRGVLRLGVGR